MKIMASGPINFMANRRRKMEVIDNKVSDFIILGTRITADGECSHKLEDACSLEEKLWKT